MKEEERERERGKMATDYILWVNFLVNRQTDRQLCQQVAVQPVGRQQGN